MIVGWCGCAYAVRSRRIVLNLLEKVLVSDVPELQGLTPSLLRTIFL